MLKAFTMGSLVGKNTLCRSIQNVLKTIAKQKVAPIEAPPLF